MDFVDRSYEINEICRPIDKNNRLLIIYGESGVGKTTVLRKAAENLQHGDPAPFILIVDFETFDPEVNPISEFVRTIAKISSGVLDKGNPEQTAGQIMIWLCNIAQNVPVYIMYDTTESIQENIHFWDWIQIYIIEPLVLEKSVKQVFAGRVPAPLRYGEIGRIRKLLELSAIKPDQELAKLICNVLEHNTPPLKVNDQQRRKIVNLIYRFSCGHPGLAKDMASYFANNGTPLVEEIIEQKICQHVVKPFVDNILFEDIDPIWKDILWWASILDSFSADILQQYLEHVASELIKDKGDYFLHEGIGQLKMRKTIIWRVGKGETLLGLIREIIQRCLQTLYPERYYKACQAAGMTFKAIADEFSEEPIYAEQYQEMANFYYKKCRTKGVSQ